MRPLLTLSAHVVVCALALGACADAPAEEPATVEVRGVFVESMYDGQAMLVNHEAIPGRMPAMRMAFRLATPALLDGIAGGTPVRLTLDSTSLEVLDVDGLPSGTALELGPDAPDGAGAVALPPESE